MESVTRGGASCCSAHSGLSRTGGTLVMQLFWGDSLLIATSENHGTRVFVRCAAELEAS